MFICHGNLYISRGKTLNKKKVFGENVGNLGNLTSNLIQKIKSTDITEARFMTNFDLP
jgi:hypothetical protein